MADFAAVCLHDAFRVGEWNVLPMQHSTGSQALTSPFGDLLHRSFISSTHDYGRILGRPVLFLWEKSAFDLPVFLSSVFVRIVVPASMYRPSLCRASASASRILDYKTWQPFTVLIRHSKVEPVTLFSIAVVHHSTALRIYPSSCRSSHPCLVGVLAFPPLLLRKRPWISVSLFFGSGLTKM